MLIQIKFVFLRKNLIIMLFDRNYAIQTLVLLKEHINDTDTIENIKRENYLIRKISLCSNIKNKTIHDIIIVLEDLVNITTSMQIIDEIEIKDLSSFLYEKCPKKYKYNDQNSIPKFLHPITDSDFIDYHDFSREAQQLIYDIIYNDHNNISVCDTILHYHNRQENPILQKVNLQYWHGCFQKIIDKLSLLQEGVFCVIIPFLCDFAKIKLLTGTRRIAHSREEAEQYETLSIERIEEIKEIEYSNSPYQKSVRYVIDLFKMAQDTTMILRNNHDSPAQNQTTNNIKSLKPLDIQFEEWEDYLRHTHENRKAEAVREERIRRGFLIGDDSISSKYRTLFITAGFEDDNEDFPKIHELEIGTSNELNNKKLIAGVLVGMLKSYHEVPNELTKRIVHFIIEGEAKFVSTNHNGTAYQYCQNFETQLYNEDTRKSQINRILKKYGFGDGVVEKLINEERIRKSKKKKTGI